jgi:hypothetical protein
MKETYYFTHDYNTRSDIKIKKLLSKHGYLGYGIYWAIIEDLYQNANALRLDYECIAYDLRTDNELVKSVLHDFDLFVISNDIVSSLSIERRLGERTIKSEKARESALARWNKGETDANALRTHCEPNAIKERKGKEIKGKEIKENNRLRATPNFLKPELHELSEYMQIKLLEGGLDGVSWENESEKFIDYYQSNGWKVGKNQMKDWKGATRNWIRNIKEKTFINNKSHNNGKSAYQIGTENGHDLSKY